MCAATAVLAGRAIPGSVAGCMMFVDAIVITGKSGGNGSNGHHGRNGKHSFHKVGIKRVMVGIICEVAY